MRKSFNEKPVLIVFFIAVLLSAAVPVFDSDFFWHIGTGKWIWNNGELPSQDPFTFTTPTIDRYTSEVRTPFLLKGYWLGQLLLYLFYRAGSYEGVILYKSLMYLLIITFLYLFMRREGINGLWSIASLMPLIAHPLFYYVNTWKGERPSYWSLAFAVVLFYILEGRRKTPQKSYYIALPFLMLLWANMHGGFILGIAMISIYLLDVLVGTMLKKQPVTGDLKRFVILGMLSIFISFINPNTYKVIPSLIESFNTPYPGSVSEHQGPLFFLRNNLTPRFLILTAIPIVTLAPFIRKMSLPQGLLLCLLSVLSFSAIRYIPFLFFIAYPLIAIHYQRVLSGLFTVTGPKKILRAVLIGLILLVSYTNVKGTVFTKPLLSGYFPFRSAEFIKRHRPEPQIFNFYDWGGFLIWKLWPDYKVFIDGRGMSLGVFDTYSKTAYGAAGYARFPFKWNHILNSYNVNTVIIPPVNTVGLFIPLFGYLIEDPQWKVVYRDNVSYVFLRDIGKNRDLINKYALNDMFVLSSAVIRIEKKLYGLPRSFYHHLSLGILNLYLEKPETALKFLERALSLKPEFKTPRLNGLIQGLKNGDRSITAGEMINALYTK